MRHRLVSPRRAVCRCIGVGVAALLAAGAAVGSAAPAASVFQSAHAHFLSGRDLQKLHRNTPASTAELRAAYDGYRDLAQRYPGSPEAARALYMAGSAQLFLGNPDDAIEVYGEVISRYPSDRAYLAKALVRKASAEKNTLDPAAAARTLARYDAAFADGASPQAAEEARLRRALEAIGQPASPLSVRRWFGAPPPPGGSPFGGRVTLLYFFATWCPNCLHEVDFIKDLQRRFGERGVLLIGVTNHSRGQTDAAVEQYRAQHGFEFPIAVDAAGATSAAYRAGSVPTAVLVDAAGVVRWHDHPAALEDAVLEHLLAETGRARR